MLMLALLAVAADPLLEDYARTAVGHFTSAAQHRTDPVYDEAEARVVRIWPERTDGIWLYQEQAIINQPGLNATEARARPYFQFVAHITPIAPGVLRRDNFRLKDGKPFVGLKAGDPRLARLTQADLAAPSCHNRVERIGTGHWVARTESCANAYKGAAFMQSLSITTPDRYVNWDRGFDAAGQRVWGPANGGYIFLRDGD